MAGRRRIHGRPRQDVRRATNRRNELTVRLAVASTPSERVAAAAAHLRSVLARAAPADATASADEAVSALTDIANHLLTAREAP